MNQKIYIKNFINYLKDNMKKIIIFLSMIFLLINSVYAETKIELSSSEKEIFLDDFLTLEIDIFFDSEFKTGEIQVLWLTDFDQFSKQESSKFTSINWIIKSNKSISLAIKPRKIWEYIIWPVIFKIWEDEFKSNKIVIKILKEENINDLWTEEDTLDKKEDSLKRDYNIFSKINFIPIFLFFLLLIIYLFFIKYNKKSNNITPKVINIIDRKKIIIWDLNKLYKLSPELTKTEFYEKLNLIFRKYFKLLDIKDSDILTLKEFKKTNLNKELIKLFETSYLNEFNDNSNNPEERITIINDFIIFLK